MTKVRVHNLSLSLDGYVAGPGQSRDNPLGANGARLHEWVFRTQSGRAMTGQGGGEPGLDDDLFADREHSVGATIMGRNMYGPVRGPWEDSEWRGWWAESPPFHHPVFVLTHHPHAPIEMKDGTTFNFVNDGIESALEQAIDAAGGEDVLVGGGAATVRQYLAARLIDELHLVVVPLLLGDGEKLFDGAGVTFNDYSCVEHVCSPSVTHFRLVKIESV